MNISFSFVLLTLLLFTGKEHTMFTQKQPAGFSVEIFDPSGSQSSLQSFIDLEYIKSFPLDTISIKDKHGKLQSWVGVSLFKIIKKKFRIDHSSISKLAATAPDGYNSVIAEGNKAEIKTAFVAYSLVEKKDWQKKYGMLRLIFPNIREMYYVSNPEKILLFKNKLAENDSFERIYFFHNSSLNAIITIDKNSIRTIRIKDIFSKLNTQSSNFSVLTSDGLEREYINNSLLDKLEIKEEKEGSWKISGAKVPLGLRTRKIFYLCLGNVGIFLKPLDNDEASLWEKHFYKQPGTAEIILLNGEKIPINFSGGSSIYNFMNEQINQFPNADHMKLSW
jgi:hypothetical protein